MYDSYYTLIFKITNMKLKTTLPFILIFIFFQGATYSAGYNWFDAQTKGRDYAQSQDDRKLQLLNNAEDRRRRIASENEAAAYQRKIKEMELEILRLKMQDTRQRLTNIPNTSPISDTASRSDAATQFKLGQKLYNSQNYKEAFKLFEKLAKLGYSGPQTNLGHMYADGLGVEKDMSLAKYWTEKAIKLGDKTAQSNWDALELWKY
jgi:TPR repeat protein